MQSAYLPSLLSLGPTYITTPKLPNRSWPMQPLVAILAICCHEISKTWHSSMNSGLTFTAEIFFQKIKTEFASYIFTYINCTLLTSITEDPQSLHQTQTPGKIRIICCPSHGPLNYPIISSALHKSIVSLKPPTRTKETDPFLILIKPYLYVVFNDNNPVTITQTLISSTVHSHHLSENTIATPILTENPLLEPTKIMIPTCEIN